MPHRRSHPVCRRAAATALIATALSLPLPAAAARYDALCGRRRCRIEVTERGFEGPAGFIPAERIVQWNAVGWDNHNALVSSLGATGGAVTGTVVGAVATCWTLIACPIGILGGAVVGGVAGSRAGRSADYQFSVAGYDSQGTKLTESFRFINARPVPALVDDLTRVSGLEMGVRRDVAIAAPEDKPARPTPQRPPARSAPTRVSRPAPAPTPAPAPAATLTPQPQAAPPVQPAPQSQPSIYGPARMAPSAPSPQPTPSGPRMYAPAVPAPSAQADGLDGLPFMGSTGDPYQVTPLLP